MRAYWVNYSILSALFNLFNPTLKRNINFSILTDTISSCSSISSSPYVYSFFFQLTSRVRSIVKLLKSSSEKEPILKLFLKNPPRSKKLPHHRRQFLSSILSLPQYSVLVYSFTDKVF